MYALTGDELFKKKAQEVADKLLPAFETETGIPMSLVNIQTGVSICDTVRTAYQFAHFFTSSSAGTLDGPVEVFYLKSELCISSLPT